jgi:hypothetical protein
MLTTIIWAFMLKAIIPMGFGAITKALPKIADRLLSLTKNAKRQADSYREVYPADPVASASY